MATERTTIGRGRCPCGKGYIAVYKCVPEPLGPRRVRAWNEYDLSYAECSKTYTFVEGKLVLKADVDEREQRRNRYHEKGKSIMASASAKQLLDKFVERLDREKSIAAKYRALKGHPAASCAESTFRRNFRSSRSLADSTLAHNLSWLVQFLGLQDDPQLTRDLEELDSLWAEMNKPIPGINTGIEGLM